MPNQPCEWTINHEYAERSRFKEYNRKHPREYAACFSNLEQLVTFFKQVGGVGTFQVGFFRSEGQGVYRIGQTGVKHAHETRLYVFIHEPEKRVQILTIGDKDTQSDDIRRCHLLAKKLKNEG